jgi:dipeptidyl aminopeptidase/acylaminoacyl peptidase
MQMLSRITFQWLFLIVFFNVTAQEKLTPELLWKLQRVGNAHISPDGQQVLYEVRQYNLEENRSTNYIMLVPLKGGNPIALSNAKQNAYNAKWRPDGKKITFLSSESGESQIYEMNTDGTGTMQVSDVKGGISSYKYSPKLSHIAFSANVKIDKTMSELYPDLPKTTGRLIDGLLYRHWDSWHDYSYSHMFIAPFANGKITQPIDIMQDERFDAPIQPFGGDEQYNWSPDGTRLAYTSIKLNGTPEAVSTNSDIYIYQLVDKQTTNFTEGKNGYDKYPSFSPDGSKIGWLSMRRAGNEADKSRLMVHYFESNQSFEVTINHDYTVNDFCWNSQGNQIYFTSTIEATKQIYYAKEIGSKKSLTFAPPLKITSGDHDYSGVVVYSSADKKQLHIVASKQTMSLPTELFVINAKGIEKQLTYTNKVITDKIAWGKVEKRWVTTTDDKKMLVWVITPPNMEANKKYPTLLYCQGGPQSPVSQFFSYRWNFQLMASQGYVVIAPNRRGLPGFGSEWNDQIIGDYGGQPMRDLLSATDDATQLPFVNKNKMGAVGASFGGYSVYWLAGNHNKRFKTFVSHCGMYNMESWYGSTEEMFFANNDNQGPYWNNPRPKNYDSSPHRFVKNWDAPILVIHNEKDFRVPLTQGMEAFTAAQLRGIPSKFLYFPDENHWVVKPQNSVLWQRVYFDWLDTYLK